MLDMAGGVGPPNKDDNAADEDEEKDKSKRVEPVGLTVPVASLADHPGLLPPILLERIRLPVKTIQEIGPRPKRVPLNLRPTGRGQAIERDGTPRKHEALAPSTYSRPSRPGANNPGVKDRAVALPRRYSVSPSITIALGFAKAPKAS